MLSLSEAALWWQDNRFSYLVIEKSCFQILALHALNSRCCREKSWNMVTLPFYSWVSGLHCHPLESFRLTPDFTHDKAHAAKVFMSHSLFTFDKMDSTKGGITT